MYKRKRAGNTITRKINSTKDTAAKADKNHYISNSYLEGFIPIDTEYFTASKTPHALRSFAFSFLSVSDSNRPELLSLKPSLRFSHTVRPTHSSRILPFSFRL